MAKTKVAILGGGVGALTTAYHLCATEELRARYDVTIYQMGWRLGGKGATGRNDWNRIQEHGLHVWFGFYNNAFKLMQDVFEVWEKDSNNALQNWRDTLKPHDFTPIGMVLKGNKPAYWPLSWPRLGGTAGDPNVIPTPTQLIGSILGVLEDLFIHWDDLTGLIIDGKLVHDGDRNDKSRESAPPDLSHHINLVKKLRAAHQNNSLDPAAVRILLRSLNVIFAFLPNTHVLRDFFAFFIPFSVGVIDDFIIAGRTADSLDEIEFTDWLIQHGGIPRDLRKSTTLRTCYDTFMQYLDGDYHKPNWAAGIAALSCVRMFFTCHEAVFWNMEAGMGEVIVVPIYQTLLQCGVKVKFFRRVENLGLSDDQQLIETIKVAKQVDLVGGGDDYHPLIDVSLDSGKTLLAWPIEPLWAQVDKGEIIKNTLAANGSSLESHWCSWSPVGYETLQRGKDFDIAVLAISLGGFKALNHEPTLAHQLQKASPAFNAMTSNIGIIPTLSMQLWCEPDLNGLGWEVPQPAAVAGPEPWSIWAEMRQTLKYEPVPPNVPDPKSVHYFCGVWKSDLVAQPSTDLSVPKAALNTVTASAIDWLDTYIGNFWPKAVTSGAHGTRFNWDVLVSPTGGIGAERLKQQIVRANVDPTECLPGSAVGSTKYRLRTDQSGFFNLFLAGCWIRTGFNTSCVEATVMSGMQAARAITGDKLFISGENFLNHGGVTESSGTYQSFLGHGEVSMQAPGLFEDCRLNVFVLPIDLEKAQTLVDTLLNPASAGAVHYRVLAPVAVCSFLAVGRCSSPTERFGWLPYREASLSLPLVEIRSGHLPRLVAWMPYVFPDATIPMVSGRESWGFSKSLGQITVPDGLTEIQTYCCETLLFERLASDCQGHVRPLLTVNGAAVSEGDSWSSSESMLEALRSVFSASETPLIVLAEDLVALAGGVADFIQGQLPVINLKQFRGAPDGTMACYQALVECPMQIDAFNGARRLRGDWAVSITECESHQVINDFGFPAAVDGTSTVSPLLALEVSMDFRANPGTVIWQRSASQS
jgi:uncharacterized protein with NAD-binding domain and iron-sulfur cluster